MKALTIKQIDKDMDTDKHANTRQCHSLPSSLDN